MEAGTTKSDAQSKDNHSKTTKDKVPLSNGKTAKSAEEGNDSVDVSEINGEHAELLDPVEQTEDDGTKQSDVPSKPRVHKTSSKKKISVASEDNLHGAKLAMPAGKAEGGSPSSNGSVTPPSQAAKVSTKASSNTNQTEHSNNMKPLKQGVAVKIEDDVRSTSSHSMRSPTSGSSKPRAGTTPSYSFNFRCVERAEKRKEYYMKLEEKNSAKEVERSSLQTKCKETQDAEIKLLRKSLTFKANPMPSFYQEPPPPKPELKKIPTTRAKSPKLGRQKSFTSGTPGDRSNLQGCRVPRRSLDETKSVTSSRTHESHSKDSSQTKKPRRRSLPKLHSEKISVHKKDKGAAALQTPDADNPKALKPTETKTNRSVPLADDDFAVKDAEEQEKDQEERLDTDPKSNAPESGETTSVAES